MFTTLLLAVFSEAYAGTVVFQPPIDKGNSQKKLPKTALLSIPIKDMSMMCTKRIGFINAA